MFSRVSHLKVAAASSRQHGICCQPLINAVGTETAGAQNEFCLEEAGLSLGPLHSQYLEERPQVSNLKPDQGYGDLDACACGVAHCPGTSRAVVVVRAGACKAHEKQ